MVYRSRIKPTFLHKPNVRIHARVVTRLCGIQICALHLPIAFNTKTRPNVRVQIERTIPIAHCKKQKPSTYNYTATHKT